MKRFLSLATAVLLVLALTVPALAAPVTVTDSYGSITISEVTSTAQVQWTLDGNPVSMTVYYIPTTCVITINAQMGGTIGYAGEDGNYFSMGGGQQPPNAQIKGFSEGELLKVMTSTAGQPIYVLVGSGSSVAAASPAAPSTPSAQQNPSTAAPAAPAGAKTVKVAGQNRTPGQIQKFSSGDYCYTVNYDDTLYDLANRFYGNGNLWAELQKVNQEYLNETADGIIFVGFNLVVPAQLAGVRASIG